MFYDCFDKIEQNPFLFPSADHIKKGYRYCVCGVDTIYYRLNGDKRKWASFTSVLNILPQTETDIANAVDAARETFKRFGNVFEIARSIEVQ